MTATYLDSGGEFLVGEPPTGESRPTTDPAIVAMGGLQPASTVDHHDAADAGVVRRMRVDPVHQRQGYGSTLLRALERRAPDPGFDRLVLDTTPPQAAAMALYESFGYEEIRRESTPAGEMVFYAKHLDE